MIFLSNLMLLSVVVLDVALIAHLYRTATEVAPHNNIPILVVLTLLMGFNLYLGGLYTYRELKWRRDYYATREKSNT